MNMDNVILPGIITLEIPETRKASTESNNMPITQFIKNEISISPSPLNSNIRCICDHQADLICQNGDCSEAMFCYKCAELYHETHPAIPIQYYLQTKMAKLDLKTPHTAQFTFLHERNAISQMKAYQENIESQLKSIYKKLTLELEAIIKNSLVNHKEAPLPFQEKINNHLLELSTHEEQCMKYVENINELRTEVEKLMEKGSWKQAKQVLEKWEKIAGEGETSIFNEQLLFNHSTLMTKYINYIQGMRYRPYNVLKLLAEYSEALIHIARIDIPLPNTVLSTIRHANTKEPLLENTVISKSIQSEDNLFYYLTYEEIIEDIYCLRTEIKDYKKELAGIREEKSNLLVKYTKIKDSSDEEKRALRNKDLKINTFGLRKESLKLLLTHENKLSARGTNTNLSNLNIPNTENLNNSPSPFIYCNRKQDSLSSSILLPQGESYFGFGNNRSSIIENLANKSYVLLSHVDNLFWFDSGTENLYIYNIKSRRSERRNINLEIPHLFSAVQMSSETFISGGYLGSFPNWRCLKSTYKYKEERSTISQMSDMILEKGSHKLVGVELPYITYIYSLGGYYNSKFLSLCERYSVESNRWTKMPSLSQKKAGVGACCFNNERIYAFGGHMGNSNFSGVIECLDINKGEEGVWEIINLVHNKGWRKRRNPGVIQINGECILVFGGVDGAYKSDSYIFNVNTKSVSKLNSLLRAADSFNERNAPLIFDNLVYVFGFRNSDIHLFHLQKYKWTFIKRHHWEHL